MNFLLPHSYWKNSRTPLYSLVFTIPLFIIYEIGIIAVSAKDLPYLRNGADVLMRRLLESFGLMGLHGFSIALIIGIVAVLVIQNKSWRNSPLQGNIFLYMLTESICWGILLYISLVFWQIYLMIPSIKLITQQVVLSVGAGIYEELVFRVLLITGLGLLFKFVFKWKLVTRQLAAIIGAAIIFSLFHFFGEFGNEAEIRLFLLRFFAGIVLGLIYILRGFGITAYAHSVYDLIVLIQIMTPE